MSGPALVGVITSIHAPTPSVLRFAERLAAIGAPLIIVGDTKGPPADAVFPPGVELIELAAQRELTFALEQTLPTGHYARKNLGHLLAVQRGAASLYETDDDNAPLASWAPREELVRGRALAPRRWHNSFAHFDGGGLWPRGLPMPHTHAAQPPAPAALSEARAPLQTALVDGSPDLDALSRLGHGDPDDVHFAARPPILIPPGGFAPVNTQSTWWWPQAYPFMYLPSTCSFRMTDIWRGFIAQRCLWELDATLAVHAPEVEQDRNPHDLQRDFADELPGHLLGDRVAQTLIELPLARGEAARLDNLRACHAALVAVGAEEEDELRRLDAWCEDVAGLLDAPG